MTIDHDQNREVEIRAHLINEIINLMKKLSELADDHRYHREMSSIKSPYPNYQASKETVDIDGNRHIVRIVYQLQNDKTKPKKGTMLLVLNNILIKIHLEMGKNPILSVGSKNTAQKDKKQTMIDANNFNVGILENVHQALEALVESMSLKN